MRGANSSNAVKSKPRVVPIVGTVILPDPRIPAVR